MATKKIKVEVKTADIDFSNSVNKIKTTAKTVNTEVVDTAIEVLEDLRTNGEKIRVAATANVNAAIENLTIENGVQFVKKAAKNINEYSLETAEEVIDATVKGTKGWQALFAKSMKEGVDLFGKSQDLTFTTLEGLKKRYSNRNFRLKQLFNFDLDFTPATVTVEKKAKKATAKATKTAKKAVAKAKPATKKVAVKATAKKVVAKAKPVTKKVAVKATAKKVVAKAKPATKKVAVKATAKKVVAKPATKVTVKNNLRVIEGIGPKIEELLNKGGIFTFAQLAATNQGTLKGILAAGGSRYKMHDPTSWNQQATLAAAGKREELAKLQDELKGGRAVK